VAVAAASGAPVGRQLYYPYGATCASTGSLPTDRQFTGQRNAGAGGDYGSLYDFGARFYSPAIGRFLSADTIVPSPGNPSHGDCLRSQALQRYAHAANHLRASA